jgi:preprotein translocase subunit SecG
VILAAVVVVIVVIALAVVALVLVQDARADDRVSMAWRDEQARDRSRDE